MDEVYAYSEHRRAQATPAEHALAIQHRGKWLRGASDTAGGNMSDSKRMIHIYRGLGLHLVAADKSVWAGIDVVKDGLVSGRLKFFNTLTMLREEYEGYHTGENGKIVKDYDDILDALRYSYGAMKSIAKTAPVKRREQPIQTVSFGDWF